VAGSRRQTKTRSAINDMQYGLRQHALGIVYRQGLKAATIYHQVFRADLSVDRSGSMTRLPPLR
jgi:hypothetical protein